MHTPKQHSTKSALLRFFSDICRALDGGNVCLLGLLDLSAAFDTVDHHILLKRLEISFGVNGPALELLRSYLTDRTQMIVLNKSKSGSAHLWFGVPQGSVVGPLLFVIYTKDVLSLIERHVLLGHCYADDTQIYFFCKPTELSALPGAFSMCIAEVGEWICSNKLKLNPARRMHLNRFKEQTASIDEAFTAG